MTKSEVFINRELMVTMSSMKLKLWKELKSQLINLLLRVWIITKDNTRSTPFSCISSEWFMITTMKRKEKPFSRQKSALTLFCASQLICSILLINLCIVPTDNTALFSGSQSLKDLSLSTGSVWMSTCPKTSKVFSTILKRKYWSSKFGKTVKGMKSLSIAQRNIEDRQFSKGWDCIPIKGLNSCVHQWELMTNISLR